MPAGAHYVPIRTGVCTETADPSATKAECGSPRSLPVWGFFPAIVSSRVIVAVRKEATAGHAAPLVLTER